MFYVEAGYLAAALLFIWGMWPGIREAHDAVRFEVFKHRVRAAWRRDVADEDVIANTGEGHWLAAYDAGMTPEEAARGVEF